MFRREERRFSKNRTLCEDGHVADSKGEATVDNFLFQFRIMHQIHKKLNGMPCIVDFWLPEYDIGIEYVGISTSEQIQNHNALKKEVYDYWKIQALWVTPETPLDASFLRAIRELSQLQRSQEMKDLDFLRR